MGRQPGHLPNSARIRHVRKAQGLTQEQVAEKADVSPQLVAKAENSRPVELANLDAIRLVLGMELRDALADVPGVSPAEAWGKGKFEIPPELANKLAAKSDFIEHIVRATSAVVILPDDFEAKFVIARKGCMEIEFTGKPDHLALMEIAYRAGAFAPLGVLNFGITYTPEQERTMSAQERSFKEARDRAIAAQSTYEAAVYQLREQIDKCNTMAERFGGLYTPLWERYSIVMYIAAGQMEAEAKRCVEAVAALEKSIMDVDVSPAMRNLTSSSSLGTYASPKKPASNEDSGNG